MQFIRILILFYGILGQPLVAFGLCQSVPRTEPSSPIASCEGWSTYSIKVGDEERVYDKDAFRTSTFELLRQWLSRIATEAGTTPLSLAGARIEYWLSVPEANPLATQGRIVVRGPGLPAFVAYVPPFQEEWYPLSHRDVGVLGNKSYPASFGYRAGELILRATEDASLGEIQALVEPYAQGPLESFGSGWYKLPVAALSESSKAESLRYSQDASAVLETINFNDLYEWIGFRERAFAFSLSSQ